MTTSVTQPLTKSSTFVTSPSITAFRCLDWVPRPGRPEFGWLIGWVIDTNMQMIQEKISNNCCCRKKIVVAFQQLFILLPAQQQNVKSYNMCSILDIYRKYIVSYIEMLLATDETKNDKMKGCTNYRWYAK